MQQGKTEKLLYQIPRMVCLVQMIIAAVWIALCGVKKAVSNPAVLEMAAENRTEVVSEYTGFLYPVFLRFFPC